MADGDPLAQFCQSRIRLFLNFLAKETLAGV